MSKKDKTPFVLKVIRWLYPKVEKVAPYLAHRYFVKLFFSPLHFKVPEKELKAETYAEKFAIDLNGKKVQCYAWGKGNNVVLVVHGWGGRATQFRRFVKPLVAAGYRVVGFDGPAHGKSEGNKTNLVEFEQALRKIYEDVGKPVAIIAHSFGGSAALFAGMNGLPINKLINIASPTMGDEIINTYLRAINGSRTTSDFFKAYILKTYNKPFEEFTSMHFIKYLPLKINLLLVHDEDDKEVSINQPKALINVYPEAQLYITKGLGHTRILKNDAVIQYCVTYIAN